jgi:tRNA (guanine-N7-)-methyltransferase
MTPASPHDTTPATPGADTGTRVDASEPQAADHTDAAGAPAVHPETGEPLHRRRIRSFVTRAGRTSKGQQRALKALAPRFCLPYTAMPLDWRQVFGREAPRILEIGFGMGATTAEIATLRPGEDFLGIEVHEPGVGALLKLIGDQSLYNIRAIQHDAVEVVEQMIEPESLDGIHIFFPDPWHKARHHKRRLIQPGFIALLTSRLKVGGYLHCATDWENYAEQMLAVLGSEPLLENTASGYAPRPAYRPVTKFERRGLRLGHGVWDLLFQRRSA